MSANDQAQTFSERELDMICLEFLKSFMEDPDYFLEGLRIEGVSDAVALVEKVIERTPDDVLERHGRERSWIVNALPRFRAGFDEDALPAP